MSDELGTRERLARFEAWSAKWLTTDPCPECGAVWVTRDGRSGSLMHRERYCGEDLRRAVRLMEREEHQRVMRKPFRTNWTR